MPYCNNCGTEMPEYYDNCPGCGKETFNVDKAQRNANAPVETSAPGSTAGQVNNTHHTSVNITMMQDQSRTPVRKSDKNFVVAIVLALFLGGIGGHQFYMGNTGKGVLYLLFFWTFIPSILALIDLVLLIVRGEKDFDTRYNF